MTNPPTFKQFLAGSNRLLRPHLLECAGRASANAIPLGLPTTARIIGLAHDLGKYSAEFQDYIAGTRRCGGDHSSAGGQYLFHRFPEPLSAAQCYFRQIIMQCCFSHHEGSLIDFVPVGTEKVAGTPFLDRYRKDDAETHYSEILSAADREITDEINALLSSENFRNEIENFYAKICSYAEARSRAPDSAGKVKRGEIRFAFGTTARFLLSCLIDGDHASASGEKTVPANLPPWETILENINAYASRFPGDSEINKLRAEISLRCENAGTQRERGIARLSLPTGSGKTLASLRFSVAHAQKHKLSRIIYVVPYTSVLTQIANEARRAVGEKFATQILEHHSDFTAQKETGDDARGNAVGEDYKKLTESWDAPIIFTTTVQFLNALFAHGAGNVRRMNKLGNAVIVFDEVQALPVSSLCLFNKAVDFLTTFAGSSSVFCTATQPLPDDDEVLEKLWKPTLSKQNSQILENYAEYFRKFEKNRAPKIRDVAESAAWELDDFANFINSEARERGNVLAIVNTKKFAKELFCKCRETKDEKTKVFHLSNSMCSAHRLEIIENHISKKATADAAASGERIICVSTQVVECGVDVDFDVVIRSLAGTDSLVQAFGRCNRDGKLAASGNAFIVRPSKTLENTAPIPQIDEGKNLAAQTLREKGVENILKEDALSRYFELFYRRFKPELFYPLRGETSLDACHLLAGECDLRIEKKLREHRFALPQPFKKVALAYFPIDEETVPVIVPYKTARSRNADDFSEEIPDAQKDGAEIISALHELKFPQTDEEWRRVSRLLRFARKFSISVRPENLPRLSKQIEKHEGAFEFYALAPGFYDGNASGFGFDPEFAGTLIL